MNAAEHSSQHAARSPAASNNPDAAGWLLAVDGGGTKIAVAALPLKSGRAPQGCEVSPSSQSSVRTWIHAGSGSAHPATWSQASLNLQQAVISTLQQLPGDQPVVGIYLALAGAGRSEDQQRVLQWLGGQLAGTAAQNARLFCSGDIEPLLYYRSPLTEATDASAKIAVILGTGSVVAALNGMGAMVRAGGWGPMLGDECSGGALGLAALQLLTRRLDRRRDLIEWTALERAIAESLQLEQPAVPLPNLIIETAADRTRRARLSLLLVQMAHQQHDPQALAILAPQLESLVWQIEQVVHEILPANATAQLLLSGGLVERCTSLQPAIINRCRERGLPISHAETVQPLLAVLQRAMQLVARPAASP